MTSLPACHLGMPIFARIHPKQYDREVPFIAFDLLDLGGVDFKREPLLTSKARPAHLIARLREGLEYNDHL